MSSVAVPNTSAPASRLRARPVNTTPVAASKTAAKSAVTKRVASPKSSVVRPRTGTTTTTNSTTTPTTTTGVVTRRTRSTVKPVAPGRPHVAMGDEHVAAAAPLTSIPTNTSQLGGGSGGHAKTSTTATTTNTAFVKTSSRNSKTAAPAHHNSGRASRRDSVCSSLPGSSEKGSADRTRSLHPSPLPQPTAPHVGHVSRAVPLTRAATAECVIRSSRQPSVTPSEHRTKKSASPLDSVVHSRTHSTHELAPTSPRRVGAAPSRTFASAPASRVSSVNSRLAEGRPVTAARAPRTRVVRTAGKRSASSNSDVAAGAKPPMVPTTPAFTAAPARTTGVRPLLPAGRRASQTESASLNASTAGVPRLRHLPTSSTHRSASQTDAGSRSARGTAEKSTMGGAGPRAAPLSGRRVAGTSPSRKVARKPVEKAQAPDTATQLHAPAPATPSSTSPAAFQQTHTGCPPPLSFGGHVRSGPAGAAAGAGAAAVTKGPVSPIKRTSTACPGSAQVYPPVAPSEDPARDSACYAAGRSSSTAAAAAADSAYASPWLRPGMFSTPTNRDGWRESSEAPTVPYEGSTGQRASLSLSPRTDFDNLSVSGRLSYGM